MFYSDIYSIQNHPPKVNLLVQKKFPIGYYFCIAFCLLFLTKYTSKKQEAPLT